VFEIAAGPGVDQRGGRQEIALVVVASAIGKDQVFDSISTAANTRYEVVGVRCPAERLATVKTAPGLLVGQTFASALGGVSRSCPKRWRRRFCSSVATLLIVATILVQCSSTSGRISGASRRSWSPAPGRSREIPSDDEVFDRYGDLYGLDDVGASW
jgi:hypothetical protein